MKYSRKRNLEDILNSIQIFTELKLSEDTKYIAIKCRHWKKDIFVCLHQQKQFEVIVVKVFHLDFAHFFSNFAFLEFSDSSIHIPSSSSWTAITSSLWCSYYLLYFSFFHFYPNNVLPRLFMNLNQAISFIIRSISWFIRILNVPCPLDFIQRPFFFEIILFIIIFYITSVRFLADSSSMQVAVVAF